jgi:penicillin-binding protein 1C
MRRIWLGARRCVPVVLPLAKRVYRYARVLTIAVVALYLAQLVGARFFPGPALHRSLSFSTPIRARDGELMRLTLAADGIYRVHTPLAQISPQLVEAFLLYEDRCFYRHPGIDPVALARAISSTYLSTGRRMGGSTITMQLARRLYGIRSNRLAGKLTQLAAALYLELRYRKRDILQAYLDRVPMGGNIEGVGAAALIYFGKPASKLSLGEALTLAVIPQNPERRRPVASSAAKAARKNRPLIAARARLLAIWAKEKRIDAVSLARARIVPRFFDRSRLPHFAPHFCRSVLARNPSRRGATLRTTLEPRLQRLLERRLRRYLERVRERGIRNAAALLLDYRKMAVRALVGSADYNDETIDGKVDGTAAFRSPGSTLKPFIYALALDQGLITPESLLEDVPTRFGSHRPDNFDNRFAGPITAWEALVRSRNIPAYTLAARLRAENNGFADGSPGRRQSSDDLYQLLQRAGIRRLRSREFHGLSLALGSVELSMRELATLYAALASDGRQRELRSLQRQRRAVGASLITPQAAFVTRRMLSRNRRPEALAYTGTSTMFCVREVAYKTGTSNGYRDAWSAGIFGPYVLVVWLGDFKGRPNPELVGATAAAPLFFSIVDAVSAEKHSAPSSRAANQRASSASTSARSAARWLTEIVRTVKNLGLFPVAHRSLSARYTAASGSIAKAAAAAEPTGTRGQRRGGLASSKTGRRICSRCFATRVYRASARLRPVPTVWAISAL